MIEEKKTDAENIAVRAIIPPKYIICVVYVQYTYEGSESGGRIHFGEKLCKQISKQTMATLMSLISELKLLCVRACSICN